METGFVYAIGAAVTWGLIYTLDQKILATVSPMPLIFVTAVMTAIVILPFIFFDNESMKALLNSGRNNLILILTTIFLGIFASFFILSGIKHLDASTASIIEIAYPFFVILFSYIIFRSMPNMYFFIGGILVFIGSIIIIKFS